MYINKIAQSLLNKGKKALLKASDINITSKPLKDGSEKIFLGLDSIASQKNVIVKKAKQKGNLEVTAEDYKETLAKYFDSHNYAKQADNKYFKDFDQFSTSEISEIDNKYGASDFVLESLAADSTIEDITELACRNNKKHLAFWNNNPDRAIMLTTRLKSDWSTQSLDFQKEFQKITDANPAIWDIAADSMIKMPEKEQVRAILNYKSAGFREINKSLISGEITPESQKVINAISQAIEPHVISAPITLYRGESLDILKKVKNSDGQTLNLAEILEKAQKEDNLKETIETLLSKNPEVEQKAFMSTSLSDKFLGRNTVNWILSPEPGTRGLFLETLPVADTGQELEVLLQKNAKLKIQEIKPKEHPGGTQWYIKAKVSN